jgi:hypothetical protein
MRYEKLQRKHTGMENTCTPDCSMHMQKFKLEIWKAYRRPKCFPSSNSVNSGKWEGHVIQTYGESKFVFICAFLVDPRADLRRTFYFLRMVIFLMENVSDSRVVWCKNGVSISAFVLPASHNTFIRRAA